ncbi:MAG: cysteine synthase A [Alphaproteobacteria bacterium]|nr:cysteine synthase A [Alphaproteobacteria bacterium]
MSKFFRSVDEIIGHTPLMEVCRIEKELKLLSHVLVKLENLNPAGSAKDRVAKYMIDFAEKENKIKPGATIIEPTSGNTGIGLASIAASRGYKIILTMPDTMSKERIQLLKAYGAEIVLTDGNEGMAGAVRKAEELSKSISNSFIPGQFKNPVNPLAHYCTTGPEIWNDLDGNVDYFIAGVGTGGTLSGVGKFLKEKNKSIKVIAVEPNNSPLLSTGKSGEHGIQGIGANFIPQTLDKNIYDDVMTVSENDAFKTGRLIAQKEGILVGISSGAALYAAIEVASKKENQGKNIVVILPDTGDRYLSTKMFSID